MKDVYEIVAGLVILRTFTKHVFCHSTVNPDALPAPHLQQEFGISSDRFYNRHARSADLVSIIVGMCMYPNIAYPKRGKWWSPDNSAFVGMPLPDNVSHRVPCRGPFYG